MARRKRRALGGGLGGLNVVTDSRPAARVSTVDPTTRRGQTVLYGRPVPPVSEIASFIPPFRPQPERPELIPTVPGITAGYETLAGQERADIGRLRRAEMEEWGGVVSRLGGRGISRADLIGMGPPGFADWMQGPEAEKYLPLGEILGRRDVELGLSPSVHAAGMIESMIAGGAPGTRAEITSRIMERRPTARAERRAMATGEVQRLPGPQGGYIEQIIYPTTQKELMERKQAAGKRLTAALHRANAQFHRAIGRGASDESVNAIVRRRENILEQLRTVAWAGAEKPTLAAEEAEARRAALGTTWRDLIEGPIAPEGGLWQGGRVEPGLPVGAVPPTKEVVIGRPRPTVADARALGGAFAAHKHTGNAAGVAATWQQIQGLSPSKQRQAVGKDWGMINALVKQYGEQWGDRYIGGKQASAGAVNKTDTEKSFQEAADNLWPGYDTNNNKWVGGIIKNMKTTTGLLLTDPKAKAWHPVDWNSGEINMHDLWLAWDRHGIRFIGTAKGRAEAARGFLTALRWRSPRHYATAMNWRGPDRDYPFRELHNEYMPKDIPSGVEAPVVARPAVPARATTAPPVDWRGPDIPGIEGAPAATRPVEAPAVGDPYSVAETLVRAGKMPDAQTWRMLTEEQKEAISVLVEQTRNRMPTRLLGPSGPLVY